MVCFHRVGSGGWSSDGIQIISSETTDNATRVVFTSTHLTSFAVLVDVSGGLKVGIDLIPQSHWRKLLIGVYRQSDITSALAFTNN